MSRADRLLRLLQELRNHRFPVAGTDLARETGVSLRTLYRDIATLRSSGADIEGAAGLGYVLRPGFTLPPLNFTVEEVEALVLGSQWVLRRGDPRLARAAREIRAKIAAVLPPERRRDLDFTGLSAPSYPPAAPRAGEGEHLALLRLALRLEHKVLLRYSDAKGSPSQRIVWPVLLGYFERQNVLAAWCEKRRGYRHFRTDRFVEAKLLEQRFPRPREELLREWRAQQGLSGEAD